MDNRLNHNLPDEDIELEDEAPAEVEEAVMEYLSVTEADIATRNLKADLQYLLLFGEREDWEEFWQSKSTGISYFGLRGRQAKFIGYAYDWIISFSDSLKYEKLTHEEKIIAGYIQERFPGRDGAGFFPQELVTAILRG